MQASSDHAAKLIEAYAQGQRQCWFCNLAQGTWKGGNVTFLILPKANTAMMQLFLEHVSQIFAGYFT